MTTKTKPWDPAAVRQRREALGIGRTVLVKITGLPGSRVWAAEQTDKTITDEHQQLILATLDRLETSGVPEEYRKPERTPGTSASQRLKTVAALLDEALAAKTIREIKALVEQAQSAISQ